MCFSGYSSGAFGLYNHTKDCVKWEETNYRRTKLVNSIYHFFIIAEQSRSRLRSVAENLITQKDYR